MRVGVLGAGLQGVCVALELAAHGVEVDLYERDDFCLARASAHNEGKIHLGYVYGNDPTRQTARTMARGAVRFQALMRRWLGSAIDTVPVSAPFDYVVHRESLLGVPEIEQHFEATHEILREESEGVPVEYFGADYRERPTRLNDSECARHFAPETTAAAYRTPEIAIDTRILAEVVRARVASERKIRCLFRTEVCAVRPESDSAVVEFATAGRDDSAKYDHLVNTLWDGRLAIDQTAGISAPRPWLYRVKHFLRMRSPLNGASLPTTTIVLGPFGDIVSYANGATFMSWYPAGLRGISSAITPPNWPLSLNDKDAAEMRDRVLKGLATIIPAAECLPNDSLDSCQVEAGIIFAWGATDIPDRRSGLHERFAVGPVSHGRYHTIDTGKLTMAPYFGKLAADRILGNQANGG